VSPTVGLPDLNVWLALACPDHGLVRLVCQPKLMGVAVKTAEEASALLEAFCQQPGVSMASAEANG